MLNAHEEITEIEAELDRLFEAAERCRKLMMAAKSASLVGGLLLVLVVLGQVGPVGFVFAIAAILGGIALFGSTKSTRDQIMQRIRTRDAQRSEMINRMEFQELGGE